MREYAKQKFQYVSNPGTLSGDAIAGLSDEALAEYLNENRYAEIKKCFRINPEYLLRKIGGEYAIIPVGEKCLISNAVMTPNEAAVFCWKAFLEPATEEDVVQKAVRDFAGDAEQIRKDIHHFVTESIHYGILREEE